jgi:hypothetical protein
MAVPASAGTALLLLLKRFEKFHFCFFVDSVCDKDDEFSRKPQIFFDVLEQVFERVHGNPD